MVRCSRPGSRVCFGFQIFSVFFFYNFIFFLSGFVVTFQIIVTHYIIKNDVRHISMSTALKYQLNIQNYYEIMKGKNIIKGFLIEWYSVCHKRSFTLYSCMQERRVTNKYPTKQNVSRILYSVSFQIAAWYYRPWSFLLQTSSPFVPSASQVPLEFYSISRLGKLLRVNTVSDFCMLTLGIHENLIHLTGKIFIQKTFFFLNLELCFVII